MRTTRRIGLLAALLLSVLALARPVAAAPSPSPSPSEEVPGEPRIEVWLDRPLPVNVAPGSAIDVGAMLWSGGSEATRFVGTSIFVRAHPATGDAEPTTGNARRDWLGHYIGRVEVPEGGLGVVEFGVTGTMCENDVCGPRDFIFPIAGTGPPPDAPMTSLAAAEIALPAEALVAGQPIHATVRLHLNTSWDPAFVPLLPALALRAREPRGPTVATVMLRLTDASSLTFGGALTIPDPGDYVLEAAMDADGGDATRFGTSMTPIHVEQRATGSASPVGLGGDDALPAWLVVAMVAIVVLGGGFLIAGFRSGGRA